MYDSPSGTLEATRIGSILSLALAVYAEWITNYGVVVLTTIGIAYGAYQFWARRREHAALMRKYAREEAASERSQ